ncbi:CAAX amino terminal protease [Corchorus olitorius]|uniref:CAAX amino terminal protease n=1 Tax=Corchorus olitorius TaxID=93759 RepID=A0A1R3IG15_9ROSI|nr:CAAX amino terminal protease [Corchorus olitorius]
MSENHDSEIAGAVEEDGPIYSQSSTNQEAESLELSHVDSKEDMFVDASEEIPDAVARQFNEVDNGTHNNEVVDNNQFVDEMERLRALLEQAVDEKEKLKSDYKEEKEALAREIYMKDQEIEGLNVKVRSLVAEAEKENVEKNQRFEVALERILAALGSVVDHGELFGDSGGEHIDLVEKSTLALIEKYNQFLSEINQFGQCLTKAESNFGVQEFGTVFVAARDELFELRKKETELIERIGALEDDNRKLLEQVESEKTTVEMLNSELGKAKTEAEQEKMRSANTKEKLSMAVTKGKALVQQRDALKQSLADKTSELEKCQVELQEKSSALEAAELYKEDLVKSENLVASLQESLSQKTLILETFEHILSQIDIPEELQSVDIVGRARWLANERKELKGVSLDFHRLRDAICAINLPENVSFSDLDSRLAWLQESFYQAKDEINILQNEISRTKEAARDEIDRLTASLSTVQQEKDYIKEELDQIGTKYEEIVGKVHQLSLDKDHLSASLASELTEKDYIQKELADLTSKYENVMNEVHQFKSEKDQISRMLAEGSGIIMGDQEGIEETSSNLPMLIDRCFGKIKEQMSASLDAPIMDAELFEKLQSLLYVRNMELMLCDEILEEDRLVRSQLSDLTNQFTVTSRELFALKEEKDILQKDLERSEEKSGLLREKLSMAVKKGKGLVQDRENLKHLLEEKNSEIEKLSLELQQQKSTVAECRDQISTLSTDLERIPKLESDFAAMKEQRDQIEKFLLESNNILQRVSEVIDRIVIPVALEFQEPIEKLEWLAGYIDDCQTAKAQTEQELREVKEEASNLAGKLAEAEATMKSVEDALTVAQNDSNQLAEEKREMEFGKKNIEIELQKAMEEAHLQKSILQRVSEVIDRIVIPVDLQFEEPTEKLNWLAGYIDDCQTAKTQTEKELREVKEEASNLAGKLAEAQASMKSLEDALVVAQNDLSQLAEEKREIEFGKKNIEIELQKGMEEAQLQANKFADESRKSLEEALALAESKISLLISEKEEIEGSRAASEMEMEKVREEVSTQTIRLTEAYDTIKSLENALSQAEMNVVSLTEQGNHAQSEITNLENELTKLKDETETQASKLADAGTSIKSLEDALAKAEKDFSILQGEKRTADQEVSTLNSKLNACMEELAGTSGSIASRSIELIGHLNNLQMLVEDQSLLSTMKQCFDRNLERLKEMDRTIKDTRNHLVDKDSELLQGYPLMEDIAHLARHFSDDIGNAANIEMENYEANPVNGDDISSIFTKTGERFQLRNKILADRFDGFSTFLDESIAALSKKLQAAKEEVKSMVENMESLKQNVKSLEMREQEREKAIVMLQNDFAILISACTDATQDLQFEVKNNLIELNHVPELEKLNHGLHLDVGEYVEDDMALHEFGGNKCAKTAEKLLASTRRVQSFAKLFETTNKAVATIIHDLQKELENTRSASEKAIDERNVYQSRVYKLESDIEALEDSRRELRLKVEDYEAKEERWKEKVSELSSSYNSLLMKEKEAEEPLLSASQLRTLLDKLSVIEVPLAESEDLEPQSSADIKKLFSVIDNFTDLQNQIDLLSYEKEELQSTLSRQVNEIEHLKEEIKAHERNKPDLEEMNTELSEVTFSLQKIIVVLGGKEFIGGQNSVGIKALLPILEKQVNALLLETEKSKSNALDLGTELLGSQKVIDELSTKIKLLEESLHGRTVQNEIVQERSIFEAPSVPTGSEISEIEDAVSVGKNTISPVASAAHLRTLKKGSTDHLALNIDSESDRLINNEETDEDKGHLFKSLNTSGLIPRQGKLFADRVDGIWVSGGRVLGSRPRARLGLMAYCGKFVGYHGAKELVTLKTISGPKFSVRAFASRKSMKRLRREGQPRKNVSLPTKETLVEDGSVLTDTSSSKDEDGNDGGSVYFSDNTAPQTSISIPSRSNVLQACTITSGLIAALGLIIRQVSHVGSMEGLPILDCSMEVSFGFEMWHLELIVGSVILISSCRCILLKTWPNFAESSEAANQQVLSSLQPYDYLVVAFLPGMSEELLFRGALLPIFGFDWKSVLVVASLFGALHLGNGRKYSFAVWATFVGIVYGYATLVSSSLIVPMASHALNNLVGGILWRYTSKSSE